MNWHITVAMQKNGLARYRDFDTDIDARAFIRKLMVEYGYWKSCERFGLDADNELVDDDIFDETMLENLMYNPKESIGLIALFYRALWAQADLYERLKKYEDLEEQGLLLRLPCKLGDTVYYISETIEKQGRKKVWVPMADKGIVDNITFGSAMIPQITVCNNENIWTTFDGVEDFGKTVFLTQAEAEEALKRIEREGNQ